MSLENYHGKLYLDYIADIKIARAEIKNMKLYPTEAVICDIYALPSHNFQAYYAMFYERNGRMQILYAKPQIYHRQYAEPVKMYTFSTNRKVKIHSGYDGRIIIGMKYLSDKSAEMIKNIVRNLPGTCILEENLFIMDGVFQAIRVFEQQGLDKYGPHITPILTRIAKMYLDRRVCVTGNLDGRITEIHEDALSRPTVYTNNVFYDLRTKQGAEITRML